jgi:hexosaminidase
MEFLLKFLKLIKTWGATGILLEYEDMFPFEGLLKEIAASNHYTKSDIYSILTTCKQLNLEVIPLVQTFGHMEFILKHGKFAHLRDSPEMPESICPCHTQTMGLISMYIDQVMALHREAKHLHIGCDEVYHLGECSDCSGQGRSDIFVKHTANVAKYAKTKYPQLESVIIWDDMLRNMMGAEMMSLRDLVVPMVWVYAEDVYRLVFLTHFGTRFEN